MTTQPTGPEDARNPVTRWIDGRIAAAIPVAVDYAMPKIRALMREELAEVVAAVDGRIDGVMTKLDDMVPDEELGEVLKQVRDMLGRLPRLPGWPL